MKINVNQKITDLEGREIPGSKQMLSEEGKPLVHIDLNNDNKPILDKDGKEIPFMMPLTLKECMENSLISGYQDEVQLPGDEKLKRLDLALRIYNAKNEVELTVDEIVTIKIVVNKFYSSALVVGKVYKMLENPGGKK